MKSAVEFLEAIQDDLVAEADQALSDPVAEGALAREVRVGILMAAADIIMVIKRRIEGQDG